ncbi:MAG TPA: ABC transporter permease [Candidatus Acidoferrum sp.]
MLENFMQDIRYGMRTLAKNPGFTVVAVLTLALGIGANTAIFSVVQNLLLRALPYTQPENLVEIWNTYPPQVPRAGLSPGDYADWRQQAKSFSEMGAYADVSYGFNLTGEGQARRVLVGYASSSLLPMLGVRALAGRSFVPEEDKAGSALVVLLSHPLWEGRFGGDLHVVGHTVTLDNKRYTVAGILPAGFQFLRWADVWMPLGQFNDDLTEHVHHAFVAIARLKTGVTISQARAEINQLNQQSATAYPVEHKNFGVLVQKLQDPSAEKLRSTLLVLFGAVGLVLLIACANIMNLLLVRNAAREKEAAVRTALGANQWRLIRQLLTESLLLSFLGGGLGLLLAAGGLKILNSFVPADLAVLRETGLNGWVLGFTLAVCLLAGLGCGLLPAVRTLNANLVGTLKQGSKGASAVGHHKMHDLLVISEVAMALVPLIGAGLLLRSFQHLLHVDPGFQTEHILTLEVQRPSLTFAQYSQLSDEEQTNLTRNQSLQFEQIAVQIRALPGVKEVGGIDDLPLGTELRQARRFVIEGQRPLVAGARPLAQFRTVSLSYFSTLQIPLRAGRLFNPEDWRQTNILINDTMARRFWPNGDALGKRIDFCSFDKKPCWLSIVGIVGNVHQFELEGEPTFDVYFSAGWTPYFIIRTASDPTAMAAAATEVIQRADASLPITHVLTMDALLSDSLSPRRFSAVLIAVFATLALALAAVGIYGVMSYTVSQRTQEIGIRMALGAQPGKVQVMILGHSVKLTLIGVGLGLAGAFALVRFLTSLLFGVGAYDAVTFVGVPVLLAAVAIAASYLPARRAVRVDPIVALRYE